MADTTRQQIVTALKDKLEGILEAYGYQTDLGLHVSEWDLAPMDANVHPKYLLDYRDEDEERTDLIGGQMLNMPFVIRIRGFNLTVADMRILLADVTRKIYEDIQLGGLSQYIKQDGRAQIDRAEDGNTATGAIVRYMVTYTVDRGLS